MEKTQPKTEAPVDEARIAEINASTLAAPEPPAVDLLGDPIVEVAGSFGADEALAAAQREIVRLEALIEALLAAPKTAQPHARTLDELPSPYAP